MSPEARDWVACRACLARHHQSCWNESGACASCRGTESLVGGPGPKQAPHAPAATKRPPYLALLLAWSLFVLFAIGGTIGYLGSPASPTATNRPSVLDGIPVLRVRADPKLPLDKTAAGKQIGAVVARDVQAWPDRTSGRQTTVTTRDGEASALVSLDKDAPPAAIESLQRWLTARGDFRLQLVVTGNAASIHLPNRGDASQVRVQPESIVTSEDLRDVYLTKDTADRPALGIQLKPDAATRFYAFTAAHMGETLAIVVDGEVLQAPKIATPMGESIVVGGGERGFTEDEVLQLVHVLKLPSRYPMPVVFEKIAAKK